MRVHALGDDCIDRASLLFNGAGKQARVHLEREASITVSDRGLSVIGSSE